MKNDSINIFFSCDDGYAPFLAVAIDSLKQNRNQSRKYNIVVLHTGISQKNINLISSFYGEKNFGVNFKNITPYVKHFSEKLHTRDYYSKTTYYRLFIPNLFPKLEKALYLDSDIVINGDISLLYDTELGDKLVGATPDEFVNNYAPLRLYTQNRVGVTKEDGYFNAGVLLMNLDALRKFNFEKVFLSVLQQVKFDVAQDQDYLNAICKNRVVYLPYDWNEMPLNKTVKSTSAKLIHFNLDCKPWQKDGVLYSDIFWKFARRSPYYANIKAVRRNFDISRVLNAENQTKSLIRTAWSQALDTVECNRVCSLIDRCVALPCAI